MLAVKTKGKLTHMKMARKCIAMQTKALRQSCASHCKPETKKIGDTSSTA